VVEKLRHTDNKPNAWADAAIAVALIIFFGGVEVPHHELTEL
jgi:hypothetical protein